MGRPALSVIDPKSFKKEHKVTIILISKTNEFRINRFWFNNKGASTERARVSRSKQVCSESNTVAFAAGRDRFGEAFQKAKSVFQESSAGSAVLYRNSH